MARFCAKASGRGSRRLDQRAGPVIRVAAKAKIARYGIMAAL
jgi:hypothetical protein